MPRFIGEIARIVGAADRLNTRITKGIPYNSRSSTYDEKLGSGFIEDHNRRGPTGHWLNKDNFVIVGPKNNVFLRTDMQGKVLERYTYVDLELEGSLQAIDALKAYDLIMRGS